MEEKDDRDGSSTKDGESTGAAARAHSAKLTGTVQRAGKWVGMCVQ